MITYLRKTYRKRCLKTISCKKKKTRNYSSLLKREKRLEEK